MRRPWSATTGSTSWPRTPSAAPCTRRCSPDRPHVEGRPANHARFAFLDPAAHDFWVDWNKAANDTVGILRTVAGQDPYDKDLHDLVGELSTRSEEFRTRWARHDVHQHRGGAKQINHPVVGRLDLMYDTARPSPRHPA